MVAERAHTTERETERETQRKRKRAHDTQRDRKTERQRDSETERCNADPKLAKINIFTKQIESAHS